MAHTICTFNVNNLYVRYKFGQTFPGDMSGKSLVEDPQFGILPIYKPELFDLFNPTQRELAGRAATNDKQDFPDVICLQEVESLLALRRFNEEHLGEKYNYAILIDSRDFRQIDVGILSRLKIVNIRTHIDDIDPSPANPGPPKPPEKPRLFSRDCLEVEIALNGSGSKRLTLFINHLKSKLASTPAERQRADELRKRQAQAVKKTIESRFPGEQFNQEFFAVIGDLNDEPLSAPLKPLVSDAGLIDALARFPKVEDRWTHWFKSENTVSQLDHILLSPALNAATTGKQPRIERRGIGFSRILADGGPGPRLTHFHRMDDDPNPINLDFRFPRFTNITPEDFASDHCPVFLEVP